MKTLLYITLGFFTTLAIFLGLTFIYAGLQNQSESDKTNNTNIQDSNQKDNTSNPPVELGKLPEVENTGTNYKWGENIENEISYKIFNDQLLNISFVNGITEVETINSNDIETLLYSISEGVSKLKIFDTAEIAYISTNYPISQKLVARGENFIGEIKISTDKSILDYFFSNYEKVFYFILKPANGDIELYYATLSSTPTFFSYLPKLNEQSKIMFINSEKIVFQEPSFECKSLSFSTKVIQADNCSTYIKKQVQKTESGFNIISNGKISNIAFDSEINVLKRNSEDTFIIVFENTDAYILELRDFNNNILATEVLEKEDIGTIPNFEEIIYFDSEWDY